MDGFAILREEGEAKALEDMKNSNFKMWDYLFGGKTEQPKTA